MLTRSKRCLFVGWLIASLSTGLLRAQSTTYVESFSGDMPLLVAIDHAGWKMVGSTPVGPSMSDTLLREYVFRVLLPQIYFKTGHLPYYVCMQGRRDYVNTNRVVDDPEAFGSPEAESVYLDYHNQLNSFINAIESAWGPDSGLLINMHSTDLPQSLNNGPWDRIAEIGFSVSISYPESPGNTLSALYARQGIAALTGADSVPYLFYHGNQWPDSGAVWPMAAAINSKLLAKIGDDVWHVLPAYVSDGTGWVNPYYRGEATISYHGTNTIDRYASWPNGLDAMQVEFNVLPESGLRLNSTDPEYDPDATENQLDVNFTWDCMDNFTDAVLESLQRNYNWSPGGSYNVIIDNDTDGFFTTGLWQPSTGLAYWGPQPSIYTSTAGDSATWIPDLKVSGLYEVFIRWTKAGTRTSNALYAVHYSGGDYSQTFDQNGSEDARWISLGEFPFAAGTAGYVTLTAGDGYPVCADAVFFRLVSGSPPANLAPVAVVTVGCGEPMGNGQVGIADTVDLDASRSLDADGSIISTSWDFGDGGQAIWDFGDGGQAIGVQVVHTYSKAGRYVARVTTTDDDGATDTESAEIQVLTGRYRIDNGRSGFVMTHPGDWTLSPATGYYGTQAIETTVGGSTARWNCQLGAAGTYEVYVRWASDPGRTANAEYSVTHSGGQTSVAFDQTTSGGQWVLLGAYSFPRYFPASVTLTSVSDGLTTCADAVEWRRIPSQSDLRLHFTFNQLSGINIPDSSEYGHDGFLFGPAVISSGISGDAISFDGTDDYAVVNAPVIEGYPFSYSVWVRTTLPDTANRRILEIANRSGQGSVYSIFLSVGDPCLGVVAPGTSWTSASSRTNINDGDWHHVAAVFETSTDKRLYVDGALKAEMTDEIDFSPEADTVTLGRDGDSNPNPDRYFQGDLDDVQIYSRVLTEEEILIFATPPALPTATPMPPTATPTPVQGILDGFVTLQRPEATPPHESYITQLTVTVCSGGVEQGSYSAVTDDEGYFQVYLPPGVYDVIVKSEHALANRLDSVTIPSGGASTDTLDFGTLSEGDADNDNMVVSADFFILRSTYNKALGDPGYDARGDFSENDVVTSADFFLLQAQYNQAGAACGI